MSNCPCGSGREYDECCGPYLTGEAIPPTAEALMRSRYTAHVREDYGYVLRTCHESTRPGEDEFDNAAPVTWTGLEIIRTEGGGEGDENGVVEFVANYKASGGTLGLHEIGQFVKDDGRWFYLDGEIVKAPQAKSEKIGRNEPCPCGSGKKYKKCCFNQ